MRQVPCNPSVVVLAFSAGAAAPADQQAGPAEGTPKAVAQRAIAAPRKDTVPGGLAHSRCRWRRVSGEVRVLNGSWKSSRNR